MPRYTLDRPQEDTIEIDGTVYHGGDVFDLPEGDPRTFAEGVVPTGIPEPAPDATPPEPDQPSEMAPEPEPDATPPEGGGE